MGAYLDTPNKEKHSESGKNATCAWGATGMQGWRTGMEDAHIAREITLADKSKGMLFGVFDGHGGQEVAAHAEKAFQPVLQNQADFKKGNYEVALSKAFLEYDALVGKEDFAMDTGTTANVILLTPTHIYCANSGDSRSALSKSKKAVGLSEDHKPQNPIESNRISKATHFVEDDRVDGNLALSRAFGDFQFKDQPKLSAEEQAVTSLPDVRAFKRSKDDDFIIMACDGIWDCLTNEECIDRVHQQIKDNGMEEKVDDLHALMEELLDSILAPNTDDGIGTDNMTAIIIRLEKYNGHL